MRLIHLFPCVIGLIVAMGCGGSDMPARIPPPPPMPKKAEVASPPPAPAPAPKIPTAQIDPVPLGMTVEGITKLCDEHLGRAEALLSEIKTAKTASDAELTWANTLAKFDDIYIEFSVGGGLSQLMAVAHPDKDVREAAKACEPKFDKFRTESMLDADFAAVVKRFAARAEPLTGVKQRFLKELLRDFKRNGLDLPPDKQQQLRAMNEELTKLGQDFTSNIADSVLSIKVKPERLKGLPASYVDQHKPDAEGLVTLTTNYPDYFPVITYAEDRSLAQELTAKFDNRAADKNLKVLDRVLELRSQKAKLLGYETWADYAIEPRMANKAETVRKFLDELAKEVAAPARREFVEFSGEYRRLGGKAPKVPNYDRLYLEEKLRAKKFGLDSKALSEYLEVGSVTTGLLKTVENLYGIEFRDAADAAKWHSDVRVLDVFDQGKRLGRIYLDLHPREGKYKHAAMFEIRNGKRLSNGTYLEPIAALVCNFPKPGDSPALMTHSDVTTYFHEFGHALHHVLTRQELASYAGTNTARDFVETPSQLFEEWAFRRETLDTFALHYKTRERIPDKLFQALTKSRSFGRALHTQRQVSLAMLDFTYHSNTPPFDTDKVFREVMDKSQQFAYVPDTHFQATFGHLMGYDAGYYSYQWALVIAQDALSRFASEGFMNRKVADDWRKQVLEHGAGEDENLLIKNFLGRPHNLKAYSLFLKGG